MHVYSTEKEEKKKEGTVGGGKELKIRKSRWWRKCMWPLWVKPYGYKGKNHSSEVEKNRHPANKRARNVGLLCVHFSFEPLSSFIIDIFPTQKKDNSHEGHFSLGVEN